MCSYWVLITLSDTVYVVSSAVGDVIEQLGIKGCNSVHIQLGFNDATQIQLRLFVMLWLRFKGCDRYDECGIDMSIGRERDSAYKLVRISD